MIEVLKYLFLGDDNYFKELSPRRLRNNPLWSKDQIKNKAVALVEQFGGNMEALIGHLRLTRTTASGIC